MNRIQRCLALLAGLAAAPVAFTAAAAAALATNVPFPGTGDPGTPAVHTVIVGGTPGWQITLIAVGAALTTAALAVLIDRACAARRRTTATAA